MRSSNLQRRLLATLALAAALTNAQPAKSPGSVDPLTDAFILLGANYLDQASTPDDLSDCLDKHNFYCVDEFALQRAAVQLLFKDGRDVALTRVLQGLKSYCIRETAEFGPSSTSPWQPCTGAARALFFLYKRPEDDAIRRAFAQFDPVLIKHIFLDAYGCSGDWCLNRPDKEAWATLIDTWTFLPESGSESDSRDSLKGIFRHAPLAAPSLILVDPEYQLDKKLEARIDTALHSWMKTSKNYAHFQRELTSLEAKSQTHAKSK